MLLTVDVCEEEGKRQGVEVKVRRKGGKVERKLERNDIFLFFFG